MRTARARAPRLQRCPSTSGVAVGLKKRAPGGKNCSFYFPRHEVGCVRGCVTYSQTYWTGLVRATQACTVPLSENKRFVSENRARSIQNRAGKQGQIAKSARRVKLEFSPVCSSVTMKGAPPPSHRFYPLYE